VNIIRGRVVLKKKKRVRARQSDMCSLRSNRSRSNSRGRFRHHFTSSFFEFTSLKHKKILLTWLSFVLLRSAGVKALCKTYGEIDPRSTYKAGSESCTSLHLIQFHFAVPRINPLLRWNIVKFSNEAINQVIMAWNSPKHSPDERERANWKSLLTNFIHKRELFDLILAFVVICCINFKMI